MNGILRKQGREILRNWKPKTASASCVLGRPYHNDPGINHEILEEFQKIGYPVLTLASLAHRRGDCLAAVWRGRSRRA